MDNTDEQFEHWQRSLAGGSTDQQTTALRQISGHDRVTGVAAAIVELSGSPDDEVRMWAAEALESSVAPDRSEVLRLIQLLEQSADGEICYWAATMLGRLGPDAAPAAGALEACVRESMYLAARERATWALCQIGSPAALVAVDTLTEAASQGPPRLRRLATETLHTIRSASVSPASGSHHTHSAVDVDVIDRDVARQSNGDPSVSTDPVDRQTGDEEAAA